jgi:hypothetical protein
MRIAHLLRKYNPAEWGGTETVIHQTTSGLRRQGVDSIVYCPALAGGTSGSAVELKDAHGRDARATMVRDPLAEAGCLVKRF